MVLQNHLIVALVVIITVVEYIHLPQPFFETGHEFWWFPSFMNDMALDLFLAVLSHIVNMLIELGNFLLFVVCQLVSEM